MAAQGKKGKRTKGTTLNLQEFIGATNLAAGFSMKSINWAAEIDDEDIQKSMDQAPKETVILPSGPKSSRGADVDMSKVPNQPPFKAFIGNLNYDTSEEEVKKFFSKLNIVDINLPTSIEGRSRGFGYAEFSDRESLIEALQMTSQELNRRSININLPDENDRGDRRGGGGGMDDKPDRTTGDWRMAPREGGFKPAPTGDRARNGYESGSRTGYGGRGSGGGGAFEPSSDRAGGGGGGAFSRDQMTGGRGYPQADPPAERKPLMIQKRTLPTADLPTPAQEFHSSRREHEEPAGDRYRPRMHDSSSSSSSYNHRDQYNNNINSVPETRPDEPPLERKPLKLLPPSVPREQQPPLPQPREDLYQTSPDHYPPQHHMNHPPPPPSQSSDLSNNHRQPHAASHGDYSHPHNEHHHQNQQQQQHQHHPSGYSNRRPSSDEYDDGERSQRSYGGGGQNYHDDRAGGGPASHGSSQQEPPRERPKLMLKPRTKKDDDETSTSTAGGPQRAATIFGDAKPVDTLQKELAIEEKLLKEAAEAAEKNRVVDPHSPTPSGEGGPRSRKISTTSSVHSGTNHPSRTPPHRSARNSESDEHVGGGGGGGGGGHRGGSFRSHPHDGPVQHANFGDRNRDRRDQFQNPNRDRYDSNRDDRGPMRRGGGERRIITIVPREGYRNDGGGMMGDRGGDYRGDQRGGGGGGGNYSDNYRGGGGGGGGGGSGPRGPMRGGGGERFMDRDRGAFGDNRRGGGGSGPAGRNGNPRSFQGDDNRRNDRDQGDGFTGSRGGQYNHRMDEQKEERIEYNSSNKYAYLNESED